MLNGPRTVFCKEENINEHFSVVTDCNYLFAAHFLANLAIWIMFNTKCSDVKCLPLLIDFAKAGHFKNF